jgi:hypothetical protein
MPKYEHRTQADNLRQLQVLLADAGGDLALALRGYTDESTRAMAARLGLDRVSVQLCLAKTYGRRYESTRRALEVGLHLPPYCLDAILDKEDNSGQED